jgi:hypothetical protein
MLHRFKRTLDRILPVLLAALLAAVLLACGTIEGVKNIGVIREDVKAELGVESGVHVANTNGAMTVTVSLASTPTGDPAVVKKKVEAIVKKRVPKVDHIVIQMQL